MSEVASFIDDDQFDGRSADKCGFEIEAMLVYMAPPGHQNPNSSSDIHTLASQDYQQINGPDVLSNTAGINQQQLGMLLAQHQSKIHAALGKNQVDYRAINPDWVDIEAWVEQGFPVVVCVPESQVFDVQVGGGPYPWATVGYNHVILCSGVSQNEGTMLFRDTANITPPNNLRPGPRTYRTTGTLQPWWATVVFPSWLPVPSDSFNPIIHSIKEEEDVTLTIDQAKQYFTARSATDWACSNGFHVANGMLVGYCSFGNRDLCGLTYLGLPLSQEFAPVAGTAVQLFECGLLVWDPERHIDHRPGLDSSESCYLLKVNEGAGAQIIAQKVVAPLKAQLAQVQADLKNAQTALDQEKSTSSANAGLQDQYTTLQQKYSQLQQALTQINSIAAPFKAA